MLRRGPEPGQEPKCEVCRRKQPRGTLRCTGCGAWGSIPDPDEEDALASRTPRLVVHQGGKSSRTGSRSPRERLTSALSDEAAPIGEGRGEKRVTISTGSETLDQFFGKNAGGGMPLGAIFLVSGKAGAGKSTLLLNLSASLVDQGARVLDATSEETREQVQELAKRMNAVHDELYLLATKEIGAIEHAVERFDPDLVIVDSISTMGSARAGGRPGTPTVIADIGARIERFAKGSRKRIVLVVAHVIKDGDIAGPESMQHLFDGTFFFEKANRSVRILRSIKNRFAPLGTAAFEMREHGLVLVENPSAHLLADRARGLPGSVVACTCGSEIAEGSRATLIEVQARVGVLGFYDPRRPRPPKVSTKADGTDLRRVPKIRMVLDDAVERLVGGSPLFELRDLLLNVPGGNAVGKDPGLDLAVAVAMASSATKKPVPEDTVVFGELGLASEVRSVQQGYLRVLEAKLLGFRRLIGPKGTKEEVAEANAAGRRSSRKKLEVVEVEHLAEALEVLFGKAALARLLPDAIEPEAKASKPSSTRKKKKT